MNQKDYFLNQLQFKIGDRWDDLNPDTIKNVNDLKVFIKNRNSHSAWPFLHFLPFYFDLKEQVSKLVNQEVSGNFNLNKLNNTQKKELSNFIAKNYAPPLTMSRPALLQKIVFIFPALAVLGSLLISTYLITALDYSGLWYITALVGLVLSYLLFESTKGLKNHFKPASILDYSKAFLVVNHLHFSNEFNEKQLESFILEELALFYKKDFTPTATID